MENPAVFIPYVLMAANVITLAGILGYAVYCTLSKGCKISISVGKESAK